MKWAALGLGLSGVLAATIGSIQAKKPTVIIVTGDIAGHLQPCGCSSPQLGGITRQATYIREIQKSASVVLVVNGALIGDKTPQEELKLQTLAESFATLGVTAINLSPEDSQLGVGGLLNVQNITSRKVICSNLAPGGSISFDSTIESQNLLIAGVSYQPELVANRLGRQLVSTEEVVAKLITDAKDHEETPVVLLNGTEPEARMLASKFPDLGLIVFRSTSDPPAKPVTVGKTLIVTPGEFGKSVLKLTLDGQAFKEYQPIPLEPSYADDPQVSRFYKTYLSEVDKQGFIDKTPRHATEAYAGSVTCAKCHAVDYKIWQHTKHSQAFADLEKVGHQRDPDCVSCHVIGLNSTLGFRSVKATPNLANVGCESCHGPGTQHSKTPKTAKMKKIGTAICVSCHTPDQSPNFIPLTAWGRIAHR